MKRLKLFTILTAALFLFASTAAYAGNITPFFSKRAKGGGIVISDQTKTTGNIWFVGSEVTAASDAAGSGRSPITPCATLDYCAGLATADNDDLVIVMANHAEDLADADDVDITTAGLKVIGQGEGIYRPTFTYTHANGEFVIGAANVTVENVRFLAGITAVTMGISVEDAGDNFTLKDCIFPEPAAQESDFIDAIDLADDANGVSLIGNQYYHTGGTGPAHFLEAGNGANDNLSIINNDIQGQFSVAAIWSNDADLNCRVLNNRVVQMTASEFAIEFTGNATGFADGNRVYTNAEATSVDYGIMGIGLNTTTTAADKSGMVYPVEDTGWTQLNATTLALIQAEVTTAIEADELDTLIKVASGTGAYPASVVVDSVIAHILSAASDPDASTYVNTTDSLQAIRDVIDAGTGVTTALDADGLDHLVTTADGTGVYPDSVVDDTILAYLMASGATAGASTYNNTTDSLEALGTQVADSNLQAQHVAANVTDLLDHLAKTADGAGVYPVSVVNDTILAYLMSSGATADASTYVNTTDSLQAIRDRVDLLNAADQVDLDIILASADPSYSHPNYLAVTADMDQATWNTVAAHEILQVTGAIRLKILAQVTETFTDGSDNATIALGVAGNTAAIIASTSAGGSGAANQLDVGEIWMDATPADLYTATSSSAILDFPVIASVDVGYTIGASAVTNGTLIFHMWWTPLDSTGAASAGLGGGF